MTEHSEQAALFSWAALRTAQYPELALLFAIPNERWGKRERFWMTAEGVKAGVPDILLPVARGNCHGLFVEMKVIYDNGKKSSVRKEQSDWHNKLREQGYAVVVAYSWGEAVEAITEYLEGVPGK